MQNFKFHEKHKIIKKCIIICLYCCFYACDCVFHAGIAMVVMICDLA